jgi:(1->4)-alpha-D-glucan 1-alpha-D-glucosylmutase
LSAPLAAKAIEDTAFYRYGRLLSRNDVGFNTARLALDIPAFHQRMSARSTDWPRSMLTTATHDHKRGEDVRARLAVISELPGPWIDASGQWHYHNAHMRGADLGRGDEYMLYQMLVGAWDPNLRYDDEAKLAAFAERICAWWTKALREAKLHSGWASPRARYEDAAIAFAKAILDPRQSPEFLKSIHGFVQTIERSGAMNSIVQSSLRCLLPGVPDLYQGADFWDFSLVDPDNRRPVDFQERARALTEKSTVESLATEWKTGHVKQMVISTLLNVRRVYPNIFLTGDYSALPIVGLRAGNALAFMRRSGMDAIAAAVPLRASAGISDVGITPSTEWWSDTQVTLPEGVSSAVDIFTSRNVSDARALLADHMPALPIAAWRLTFA